MEASYAPARLPNLSLIELRSSSLPYRNVAIHFCYNNPAMRPALRLLQLVAGRDNRIRFRTHFGSHMEIQYSLMTFGIHKQIIPVDGVGNMRTSFMEAYFARRHEIETALGKDQPAGVIDFPGARDILLGRGKPYQEYPGNLLLAQYLDCRREEYLGVDRFEKTVINMAVTKHFKEGGARFLQRDGQAWVEVDETAARQKVASGFRTKTRRNSALHPPTEKERTHHLPQGGRNDLPLSKRPKVLQWFGSVPAP